MRFCRSSLRTCLPLLALLLTLSPAARAQVVSVIDNYPPANDNGGTTFFIGTSKALGFTMGAQSVALADATLRLAITDATNTAMTLRLLDNNPATNNPQNTLLTFTNPTLVNGTSDYTFIPSSAFVLNANTTYWLTLQRTGGALLDWKGSIPTITPTGAYATHSGARLSDTSFPPTTISTTFNTYQINGVVPEPGTLALAVSGLLPLAGVVVQRRRRRRQQRKA